ncbi:MAG: HAD family phosphatase [Patescibacteria group bacterium]
MIKTVIFDVGGVLKSDSSINIEKYVCSRLNITTEKYHTVCSEIIPSLVKGEITELQFWKLFLKNINSSKKLDSVKNVWKDAHKKSFKINEQVFDMAKKIKEKGYIIAVLSNATQSNVDINRKSKVYSLFPVCILSCEVGLMKPDPKIYKLTLKKLNAKPKETLFIDDRKINIEPAKKLGIQTILYKSSEQLKKEFIKLNLL